MNDTRIRHEAPKNLAAFRRMVSAGVVVHLVEFASRSGHGTEWVSEKHRYLGVDRVAVKVTGEYAILDGGGSRLEFGKSGDWTFTARNTGVIEARATVLDAAGSGIRLTYILTA